MSCRNYLSAALVVVVACGSRAVADVGILYVDDSAVSGGSGDSWESPQRFLSDALATAKSDPAIREIRVAQGMYFADQSDANPGGSLDPFLSFSMIPGVPILGGYAGVGAANPDERDIAQFPTIVSGDLEEDDGSGAILVGINSHHLFMGEGSGEFRLDGLMLRQGSAMSRPGDPFSYGFGAAARCDSGHLVLNQCSFVENSALRGGAVYVEGSLLATNTSFVGNRTILSGGAVMVIGSATFLSCHFSDNQSGNDEPLRYSQGAGGAVNVSQSPVIMDCLFDNNYSVGPGGAVVGGSDAVIRGSKFTNNKSVEEGGALDLGPDAIITMCTFIGNHAATRGGATEIGFDFKVITNCRFVGNSADLGGAISCLFLNLANSAFTGNVARRGGVIYHVNWRDRRHHQLHTG